MKSTVQICFLIFLICSNGVHSREEKTILKAAKTFVEDVYQSDAFCYGWKVAAVSTAIIGGIPLAAGALGFGAAGVTSGTLAAAYQSSALGGTVLAGSTFSVLQSIGAAGFTVFTKAAIGVGSAIGVATIFGTKCSDENVGSDGKCKA